MPTNYNQILFTFMFFVSLFLLSQVAVNRHFQQTGRLTTACYRR